MKDGVNRVARRDYEKKYRENNPESRSAIVKRSMEKNKSHHKAKRKEYLQTSGGKASYRKYTQKRYALRKDAFVEDVTPSDIYNEQSGKCYICHGHFSFEQMHCDHIHPIALGGKHEKSNCAMACAHCNLSKGAKPLEEVRHALV